MRICHRNLNLDNIVLRPVVTSSVDDVEKSKKDDEYCCTISQFGNALRVPCSADGTIVHVITSQLLKGDLNAQFVAPEIWNDGDGDQQNGNRPFDGYAVDLWAVSVMLMAMLFGVDSMFVAPVPEDRIYQQICVHGHLREFVAMQSPLTRVGDDALDLLQHLLHSDPKDRLTLSEVQCHPWVVGC
jgi:serine/threonine protein kinase